MSTVQPAGREPRARKKGLESLEVWWKARELAVLVYQQPEKLPPDERYGLASQLRRVSVSVVANIAEGHGRLGRAEYHHHVSIALGSVIELKTLLLHPDPAILHKITLDPFALGTALLLSSAILLFGSIISFKRGRMKITTIQKPSPTSHDLLLNPDNSADKNFWP